MSKANAPADWEVCEAAAARAAFDGHWDAMARRNPHATAFQSASWYRAWTEAVAPTEGQIPLLIRFGVNGVPTAAVALQRAERNGRPVLTPLSWPWADYHDAVGDLNAGPIRALVPLALAAVAAAYGATVELTELVRGGLLDQVLPTRLARYPATPVLGIDLSDQPHLARIAATKEYVVKLRRLSRVAPVSCRHFTSADEISARFGTLVELHQRRWSGRSDAVAPFDADIERGFRSIIRYMAPVGQLLYTEFRVGDVVLASYLGLRWKEWYGAYRTAYDDAFRRYSPGHLMLRAMIEDFALAGVRTLDLTRGAYSYKTAYANRIDRNVSMRFRSLDLNSGA